MNAQAGEPIDLKFKIGHVLFIDLIGYSRFTDQRAELADTTGPLSIRKTIAQATVRHRFSLTPRL